MERAQQGEDIVLYGRGGRIQSYIDVRDVARALFMAIQKNISGVYNLGGVRSYSNLEVAQKCIQICGGKSRIIFQGMDEQELQHWVISSDKLWNELKFKAKFGLEDSLIWMNEACSLK